MLNYKILLGAISVILAFIGYGNYFKQIFTGKAKPHAFTWFVWTLTTGIIFVAQIAQNAGAGAWVTGALCLICFVIFITAFFKGERKFAVFDWISLIVALMSLVLWKLTKQPALSVVLVTITDFLGILPTIRKSYQKPFEENATLFSLNSFRSLLSILALQSYSLTTWLYPSMLLLANGIVVLVILIRRP